MKSEGRSEWPHWLILAFMFLLAGVTWSRVPDRVPVHWNGAGEVDRFGGRFEALLLPALIGLGVYLLLLVLPRIDPGRENYPRFRRAYEVIRLAVLVALAGLHALLVLAARGRAPQMEVVVPILVGALLVVLGNVIGKVRPNWFFGFRTPWTLSSKAAWSRTNRLGGRGMLVAGLSLIGVAVLRPAWGPTLVIGWVALGIAWMFGYSWWVWRNDPDKVPPAGTLPADEA